MPDIWFISDTHFQHRWRYSVSRAHLWSSLAAHDEALIENWNKQLRAHDKVYFLGDFGSGTPESLAAILQRLHGQIYFIAGNHDTQVFRRQIASKVEMMTDFHILRTVKPHLVLCHYPLREWAGQWNGWRHLHGHSHGRLREMAIVGSYDVGVDCNGFCPVHLEEIEW